MSARHARRSLIDYPTFAQKLEGIDGHLSSSPAAEWCEEEDPARSFEPIWPDVPREHSFTIVEQITFILLGLLGAAVATFLYQEQLSRLLSR